MLKYLFIFLFYFGWQLTLLGQSANVVIKGIANSSYLTGPDTIYAATYDDYISYTEKELAQSSLDSKGSFSLSFSVTQPTYILLNIDNAQAQLVVEPGKTYAINFLAKDPKAMNMLSMTVPVEIEFNNSDNTELNYLMTDFSNRYQAFLEYHSPDIIKRSPVLFSIIDTMKDLCSKKYSPFHNNYLNTYIQYTFALLEGNLTLGDQKKILERYISNQPVLLGNFDYMAFFNQFYAPTIDYIMSRREIGNKINIMQEFSAFLESFKKSTLITNDSIRETVALKSLSEYYRYSIYKVNAVLTILKQASKECKVAANRKAAENLIKKLSVMNIGKPAPSLIFLDQQGKPVSLSDFKGKYLYINFWATWCASCTQEMMLIPELKKSYGRKVQFISVSVDKDQARMNDFIDKNQKLDWTFLYCNNLKTAKEEFHILTVPTYYLIDPKGNVYKSPAANPVDIEPILMSILKTGK